MVINFIAAKIAYRCAEIWHRRAVAMRQPYKRGRKKKIKDFNPRKTQSVGNVDVR